MKQKKPTRVFTGIVAILLLLVGCNSTSKTVMTHTSQPSPMPSPTWCVGWNCILRGVVYADEVGTGNELESVKVELSQKSYCSPTIGRHEAITNPDGEFEFEVYIHDTDIFRIEAEEAGYEQGNKFFGGFDCLFCSCYPLEIVLKTQGGATSEP